MKRWKKKLLPKIGEEAAARARLVATEHAMNVVEHSGLGETDEMRVQLVLEKTGCRLVFMDSGRKWDMAGAARRTVCRDDYYENGRGLMITNIAADSVERYRRDTENIVEYHFRRKTNGE